jgi:HSP20 family protein
MANSLTRLRETAMAPFERAAFLPLVTPTIRVEQYSDQHTFIARAELPGLEPDKDFHVTIGKGVIGINLHRTAEPRTDGRRTEFHYGKARRTIELPDTAVEASANARYINGILEITVKLGEPKESGRRLPIHTDRAATTPRKR